MNEFNPSRNINYLHHLPRFGHTNNVAHLLSRTEKISDYMDGVTSFSIFLSVFTVVWLLLLFSCKTMVGKERAGCAAGGEPIDIEALRAAKVRRWNRKQRVERSWKLQKAFFISSLGIPAFTAVLLNRGFQPFFTLNLSEVAELTGQVEYKAYRAIQISNALTSLYGELSFYGQHKQGIDFALSLCPNFESSNWANHTEYFETTVQITNAVEGLGSWVGTGTDKFVSEMEGLALSMGFLSDGINKSYEKDWYIQCFLFSMNSVNLIMLLAVALSRMGRECPPMDALLAYAVIPIFVISLLGLLISTCVVSVVAILNADFCGAGPAPGGPLYAMTDYLRFHGYSENSLPQEMLDFYVNDCDGDNPLSFTKDLNADISEARVRLETLLDAVQVNNIHQITAECGTNAQHLNQTFSHVAQSLRSASSTMRAAMSETSCSSMRPILQKMTTGVTCTGSIDSLTWLLACLLVLVALGVIMLTVRAAMFNPIIPQQRKNRRKAEFKHYKKYMENHGYDTSTWVLDVEKKEVAVALEIKATFDTEDSDSTGAHLSPQFWSGDDDGCLERNQGPGMPQIEDDESVESADSDESSLVPPVSVIGSVASSISLVLKSPVRQVRNWFGTSSDHVDPEDELDLPTPEQSAAQKLQSPKVKSAVGAVANIFTPTRVRRSEVLSCADPDEVVPLTPDESQKSSGVEVSLFTPTRERRSKRRNRAHSEEIVPLSPGDPQHVLKQLSFVVPPC